MNKKFIIAVLVLILSFPTTYVFASARDRQDKDGKSSTQQTTQTKQTTTSSGTVTTMLASSETVVPVGSSTESSVSADPGVTSDPNATSDPAITPDPTVTHDPSITPNPEATTDPSVPSAPPATATTEPNETASATPSPSAIPGKEGNRKVSKEDLKKKIEEHKQKRTEAKEYIKDIKKDFKNADKETKKEILAEIAKVKKELKDDSIGVFLKGADVDFDKYDGVKPVIKDGRTLVPVRAISEGLGAQVSWTEESKTITISKDNVTIVMQLDNKIATVNGVQVELDVAPTTIKDRTMVPMRFISETFRLNVDWDSDSQTVVVEE